MKPKSPTEERRRTTLARTRLNPRTSTTPITTRATAPSTTQRPLSLIPVSLVSSSTEGTRKPIFDNIATTSTELEERIMPNIELSRLPTTAVPFTTRRRTSSPRRGISTTSASTTSAFRPTPSPSSPKRKKGRINAEELELLSRISETRRDSRPVRIQGLSSLLLCPLNATCYRCDTVKMYLL